MRDPKEQAREKRRQAFWPVMGFLMLVALVGISYFAGPAIVNWLDDSNTLRGFPPSGTPIEQVNWIVRGIVFVVLAMFASLVVAASAPKKRSTVTERDLIKDRNEAVKARKIRKLRQKQINQQGRSR